ncbi:LOW QUALITY PROTEIN: SH2 domain-containing protein 7-like [Xyrichtys novacula]|uniref:LOW QUALITY PROTEIN: SH2 domain-containing protein 7-like n=1 Tax=Xyrichtys novacula TaxID=13765 RepID=A0AAV1F6P9_XYRNO|nr:LOW QUALITY PROTEIN: SH2 domain-containing protein 7-like [Xyrichtys novacula]
MGQIHGKTGCLDTLAEDMQEELQLEVKDSLEVEGHILMSSEMTPGSNQSLPISRKGIDRNCCKLNKYKPKSERICHFSGSKTKEQKVKKSPRLRTCMAFCFKDRVRMEHRGPAVDSYSDRTDGRLRELASKWFIETQMPFIVHNGFFPSWFLGFITRKDAEEILREKDLGCYLIRLSEKAIGYILSYKGRDRCRHFVINQSESGQFVVCGDTRGHDTIFDLIEHYKTSSIQPFREYLTSSCCEVSPKEKPAAAVKNGKKQHLPSEQPPSRPPKTVRTPEEVPPLPRRSRNLDAATLNNQDNVLYAQLRKQSPREKPRSQHYSQDNIQADKDTMRVKSPSESSSVYYPLNFLESKSRSLPLLDNSSDEEKSYRLSATPHTPPRLSPKPSRQAASCSPQQERTCVYSRPNSSHSLELQSDSAVYHLAGRPGSPHAELRSLTSVQHHESVYTEVTDEALLYRNPHFNTYESISVSDDPAQPEPNSITYEPPMDIRPKSSHSSCGLKNDKWKWLLPDIKRKW